jgi:hypothetical protein
MAFYSDGSTQIPAWELAWGHQRILLWELA